MKEEKIVRIERRGEYKDSLLNVFISIFDEVVEVEGQIDPRCIVWWRERGGMEGCLRLLIQGEVSLRHAEHLIKLCKAGLKEDKNRDVIIKFYRTLKRGVRRYYKERNAILFTPPKGCRIKQPYLWPN